MECRSNVVLAWRGLIVNDAMATTAVDYKQAGRCENRARYLGEQQRLRNRESKYPRKGFEGRSIRTEFCLSAAAQARQDKETDLCPGGTG
jgi:hypothetical protein